MARKIWPETAIDRLVNDFLQRKGIKLEDVRSYRIDRGGSGPGVATIHIEMFYDDGPDMVDVTSLDQLPGSQFLPRVSTVNPNTTDSDGNPHHNHR